MEAPSHAKDTETCKKICIITKDCQDGEVRWLKGFKKLLVELKNTRIQSLSRLQNFKHINHPKKRVLQIDYALAYQSELQNETMGALWSRGNVNLFTRAVYHNSDKKNIYFWYCLEREG